MKDTNAPKLLVVLGDQLSLSMPSLRHADPYRDIVLMAEVAGEATYVRHHKKKIAFVLSAMRHFAGELKLYGWPIRYVQLGDPDNTGTLMGEIERARQDLDINDVVVTAPGEHRLAAQFANIPWLEMLEDDRFLTGHADFNGWADDRKHLRMDYFYREMRRKTGLLMAGSDPVGGQWTYDPKYQKPSKQDMSHSEPLRFEPDAITKDVLQMVERRFDNHFGTLRPFWFGVTRKNAQAALEHFATTGLPHFGDHQDAMLHNAPFLYHSVLSLYLNVGLLSPLEVCRRVERAYTEGHAPLNAAESYIRQIIGWREYLRGIYWREMPGYTKSNHLNAKRALPEFYWTAMTDMACMADAIDQTRDEAYAHHVQRLMVTGNFALLAGIDPVQVHEWYLAVYADAYEWVEAPNVIGMSQFADGGLLGSKLSAASGTYINTISDHCGNCRYDVHKKTGEGACPFNPLYWDFLKRNEDKLRGNSHTGTAYQAWDRMSAAKQQDYLDSAAAYLKTLDDWDHNQ